MAVIDSAAILIQIVLYICTFVGGFLVCIPVGVSRSKFEGNCFLYLDVTWTSETDFVWYENSGGPCNYAVFFSIFGLILYSLLMAALHVFALCKLRMESMMGSSLKMLAVIVLNSAIGIFTLVCACIISVGFKQFCDALNENLFADKGCDIGESFNWSFKGKKFQPKNYKGQIVIAQVGAWCCFLIFCLQVGIGVLRFLRSRRQTPKGKPTSAPKTTDPTPSLEKY